ncbi:efflux RND transporter periplasmic adaptor subunit [candidate division KSB1 bacterium]|nr:efflux RND transporter periplasmic adaptor subunit [candidate division KSB1 bacterium]
MKRIIELLLLITALVLVIGCGAGDNEGQREEAIYVKTAPVKKEMISIPVVTSGRLSTQAEMKLSFKTGGILETLNADEGQMARQGQTLAALNLAEIEAKVKQAESAYQKAVRDLERVQRLFADSVATLEQRQDAETGVDIAEANLKVAKFNLRHSKIIAPSTGRILKRFVEKNELVSAGMPVFLFGSTENDWVIRVGVTDRDIMRVHIGDSATVKMDAYPARQFGAIVSEIAEFADPRSGTFEIELRLDPGELELKSGFNAQVTIFPSARQAMTIVPIEALVEGDRNTGFVFTLNESKDTAEKIKVRIDRIFDGTIGVSKGLESVSEVVTEGASYLTDGSKVVVTK